VLLIPDDDDTQKKRRNGRRQRKNLRYRLGSLGLEGRDDSDEHIDEEDEDENLDSEEEEEGGGSDSDGFDRTGRTRETGSEPQEESEEEPRDKNLEAYGFRSDSDGPIRDLGDEEDDFNTVQISELHSKEPFVLFRGKYYKCQWHRNIGTELLFMKHDPDDPDPLPSLRTLTGDVDLLAASSARIMSREVLVTPKPNKGQKSSHSGMKSKKLAIDIGRGSGAKRKKRAKFLEELINKKLEMGELDGVTVNAISRKSVWKWNNHLTELARGDIKVLEKIVARGGKAGEEAARKIQEIEEDMQRRQKAIGGKKKGGPPAGMKKPIPGAKPKKGKSTEKSSQDVPDTPARPASGAKRTAPSSRGDVDSDEMDDSEVDSEEGDSGEGRSGEEDSGDEGSDEEDSEEGDSEDEDGSSNSEDDDGSDGDGDGDDEDTTMYD